MASTTLSAPIAASLSARSVDLGHEMAQRQVERIWVAARSACLVPHDPNEVGQLHTADTERLKAVTQPARPTRGGAAVSADMDRYAPGGLGIASGVVEVEELAVMAHPVRLLLPQQPHHRKLFVGAAATD